jgi:hypothetical protein
VEIRHYSAIKATLMPQEKGVSLSARTCLSDEIKLVSGVDIDVLSAI